MIDIKEILDYIDKEQRAYKQDLKSIAENRLDSEQLLDKYLIMWFRSDQIRLVLSACTLIDTITETDPEFGLKFKDQLFKLLDNESLQVGWRALAAIENFCQLIPNEVYDKLEKIIRFMDSDSIVARDKANQVFAKLSVHDKFRDDCLDLMFEQINLAANNQSGQYAERAVKTISKLGNNKISNEKLNQLKSIMVTRLNEYTNEYHIKRMNKLIDRLDKFIV